MLQPAVEMQKKPGKPGFFGLPLCFGRESGPIGGPGRWGGSAAPSGAYGPPSRQTPPPPVDAPSPLQRPAPVAPPGDCPVPAEGAAQGCAGGRRHLAAGATGPGLPNGKPGPGGQGPPGPGFQGAARPRRPPRSAAVPTAEGRKGRGKGDRQNRRQDQMPLR